MENWGQQQTTAVALRVWNSSLMMRWHTHTERERDTHTETDTQNNSSCLTCIHRERERERPTKHKPTHTCTHTTTERHLRGIWACFPWLCLVVQPRHPSLVTAMVTAVVAVVMPQHRPQHVYAECTLRFCIQRLVRGGQCSPKLTSFDALWSLSKEKWAEWSY